MTAIGVTDHAVERYLQRVRGVLDARPEIAGRVRRAYEAGRVADAERGTVHVRDRERPDLVYVCIEDRPRDALVVVTLWEEGEDAAVPRRFTDALRGRRGSGPSEGLDRRPAWQTDGMRPYEGLFTAMVTPFLSDGRVNEDGAVALGRHLLAHGSDGLVVCGTTGESPTLDDDEQVSLVRTMVSELAGEAAIVAGAGSNDTRHATHLAERMSAAGARALLCVTGYYNRPNRRGIIRHYEEVARAAGGTPIIVYNIPSRTTLNLDPDLLAELAQIEGVEGVKQSHTPDLGPIDGMTVFTGNDQDLARALDLGCAGGICVSSHIVGPEMKRMFDEPGRRAEIDASLRDVFAAMFCTASPIPVKAALNLLGHDVGGLRLPLVEADEQELDTIRGALERHGLTGFQRTPPTPVHAA